MQLGLSGHPDGLSSEDTKVLWVQSDTDGNGVVDYVEFLVCSQAIDVYFMVANCSSDYYSTESPRPRHQTSSINTLPFFNLC